MLYSSMLNSEDLINKVKSYNRFLNPEKLNKAYNFAVKAHKNQKRDSGDPYSNHPIAVANILTELKLDSATIATGLLHDTIEDTHATYETIKHEFGKEVADLVEGVTKISVFENQATSTSKAENFRKLILATSKDIRVLLVKIADRLHNMRTINAISKIEKKERIAKETMEIYAPLADRMGMHSIRDELEDLSFKVLNNNARELIKKRLDEIKDDKVNSFNSISLQFSGLLNEHQINAQIIGREKTPFSIWRKVQKKRISLEQISDIIGFRVILDNVEDCYKALGIFHKEWNCIPGKFKDYISSPKINKYQSLHTSIIGPNRRPIEIQIRTMQMHEYAERGIASHWKYKSSEKFNSLTWKEYDWLADLVEIIDKNENPEHSYEYTKLQMFQENVFCFTPKGSVIKLPKDATPIDFAYAVHTKIGNSTIACKINGNDSELQNILYNGDVVDIITSKNKSPSLHWIPITKTGKARSAIRKYWYKKGEEKAQRVKKYNTTLWISLPDKPGKLGEITTLLGQHRLNISSVEMKEKSKEYINFKFNLIIRDLKNFTNFISELKQKEIKFKIIRHEDNWLKERNAFTQKIFKYFKKN
jgi:guanosine-3',5'-bis(diphosphate) 3'-pyrophosphohydrolase